MKRREFLSWIGFAPLAAKPLLQALTAASVAAAEVPIAPAGRWAPVRWVSDEFYCDNSFGLALEVEHSITGEVRRNAVRVHRILLDDSTEMLARAGDLLLDWAAEGARVTGGYGSGVAGDEVLEGREMRLPAGQT